MEHYTQQEYERFNSLWEKSGECHIWKNFTDRDGYGLFYFRKKGRRAHRVSFYFAHGPIKDEMVIDHICRNRSCVNPNHLRMVTKRENALENTNSVAAINRLKTVCPRGHVYDRKYGKQRYCSICDKEKKIRLRSKWIKIANETKC